MHPDLLVFDKKGVLVLDIIFLALHLVPLMAAMKAMAMISENIASKEKQKTEMIRAIMKFNDFSPEHICWARPYNH